MTLEEAKKSIAESIEGYKRLITENERHFDGEDLLSRGNLMGLAVAKNLIDSIEPARIPERMTLTELAHELRKLFNFRWLTYDRRGDDWYVINLWKSKPVYEIGMWCPKRDIESDYPQSINRLFLKPEIELDLSEYPDTYGQIDYSKCIVEVE